MKIYLLTQDEVYTYDSYDSAVVIAASPKKAKEIHPDGCSKVEEERRPSWATTSKNVTCILLGEAKKTEKSQRVVCASFNAA